MEVDVLLAEGPALARPLVPVVPVPVLAALAGADADDYARPSAERCGFAPRPAVAGGRGGGGMLLTIFDTPEPPNDRDGAMTRSEYDLAEFSDEDGAAVYLHVCWRTGYDPIHADTRLHLRTVRGLWADWADDEDDQDG